MPHFPKPEKGRTPKRITTKNPPGGPNTPGAKRDALTVNNQATRDAGKAPPPLVSDIEVRNELRKELRRKERANR